MTANQEKLYEGKSKIIFEGSEEGTYIQHFKDDMTAFNAQKKETFKNKGVLNNYISEYFMMALHHVGIPNHFIQRLNDHDQLVQQVEIVPIEVVVRNVAAGSLLRLGVEEGTRLDHPIVEYYYKSDELNDPMLTMEHISAFDLADDEEVELMTHLALRVNDILSSIFYHVGIDLVDFKLEFGRYENEYGDVDIMIADEITPDSARLWDIETGKKLDKDVFRKDLGNVMDAYEEVTKRLNIKIPS